MNQSSAVSFAETPMATASLAAARAQTTATKRGRLPLHLEISEMLAREIKAGVLLEGEKLEPERAMAKRLGIAVGTLRKALAELHDKGMLERVQGSGNYVRNVEEASTIYGFFRLELLAGGGLPSAMTLAVDEVSGGGEVTFSESDSYYRIRRLRYLNEVGAALEEIWLDASYVAKPLTLEAMTDSLYQLYKDRLGFWIGRVEDSLSVRPAPNWKPGNFCEEAAETFGFVERRSWDQYGKQAEYSKTWFDCDTTRYVARWK